MPIDGGGGGGAGGPATQIDANGTILDIDAIADTEALVRSGSSIVGQPVGAPGLHAATHELGGLDELEVTGLSGELLDPQEPKPHTHLLADLPAALITDTELAAELANYPEFADLAPYDKRVGWHRPPASPHAMDDEFTAATLDLVKWEKFNDGGTTLIDVEPEVQRLIMETAVGASTALRCLRQPAPAGSPTPAFTMETCFTSYTNNLGTNSRFCGLFVRTAGVGVPAGRILAVGMWTNALAPSLSVLRYTDENTFAVAAFNSALGAAPLHSFKPPYWLRMVWNTVQWSIEINQDGDPDGWQVLTTETSGALGTSFSHVGLFTHCNTAAMKHRVAFQHFRVS